MLFQPSNILPDVINGLGNGTVDIEADGLTVSWQINGNSLMTAYAIYIYQNNTASTQLYTTGKITLSTPVSGTDYQGNIQRFTATTIPNNTLTGAGLSNGNDYKLKIVEYYEVNNSEVSIEQRSMSVFHARTAPTVTITSPGSTIAVRKYSFTGTYSQTEGDALAYVRWQLYDTTGENDADTTFEANLLYDSGNMFGVVTLQFDYDSFLNGNRYNLVLTIETENGIRASDSVQFTASWSTGTLPFKCDVCVVNSQSTATKISWGGFNYNQGQPSGEPEIVNGVLQLNKSADSILWDGLGGDMEIESPWMFIMRTQLQKADSAQLIKLTSSSGYIKVDYSKDTRALNITKTFTGASGFPSTTSSTLTMPIVPYDCYVTLILTPSQFIIKLDKWLDDGLVPRTDLYPSETLYPKPHSEEYTTSIITWEVSYTQGDVTKVEVGGAQYVDYIQVYGSGLFPEGSTTECAEIVQLATGYVITNDLCYLPSRYQNEYSGSEFMADFSDGTLNAGILRVGTDTISGWSVYRRNSQEKTALHLMDLPFYARSIIDYGAACNKGTYVYDVYPIGTDTYLTEGTSTEPFVPCYANWSLIEAEEVEDEGYFRVINEFVFGKNFSSGSISNSNAPTVSNNFTRYATVQMSNINYQKGALNGLIGHIGFFPYIVQYGDRIEDIAARFDTTVTAILDSNPSLSATNDLTPGQTIRVFFPEGITEYRDDKKLRDDIWKLSTTTNHIFLKSMKGDVIEVRISGETSMSIMDSSKSQAITGSIPWVQVGDAMRLRILGGIG